MSQQNLAVRELLKIDWPDTGSGNRLGWGFSKSVGRYKPRNWDSMCGEKIDEHSDCQASVARN